MEGEIENTIFLIDGDMVDISKLSIDELQKYLDKVDEEIAALENELVNEDEDISVDEILNEEE